MLPATGVATRLAMDWSGCPAVERVAGKVSGQWIVKGTRILADGVLENADAGYTAEELAGEIDAGLNVDQRLGVVRISVFGTGSVSPTIG
jgi:hypothetical protein